MASAVDSRLAYARLSAVATASRLPTANRGSNNSYTTSWDTTHHSVVLVSHTSAPNMQRVQRELAYDLAKRAGNGKLLHVPVSLQMRQGSNRESTHRTRSFFFAALGVATARMFGLRRLRFYEKGVVSLNLPPPGQVVGSRATRSTHPQVLARFGRLFSGVFDEQIRVDNPAVWKTKTDVLSTIRDLGAQDLIRFARSCGEVRKMTRMYSHCGLCSTALIADSPFSPPASRGKTRRRRMPSICYAAPEAMSETGRSPWAMCAMPVASPPCQTATLFGVSANYSARSSSWTNLQTRPPASSTSYTSAMARR